MEKMRKIIKCVYKGEVDAAGLPHGKGVMNYIVEKDPAEELMFPDQNDLRYKGEFVHGLRQGEGDLHALGIGNNPVSEYEWYSEGEYDRCGRLIHSSHRSGTWQRHVRMWYPYFEGTWQDDMPQKPRWGEGTVEESVGKMAWKYIRDTAWNAIKTLTCDINKEEKSRN